MARNLKEIVVSEGRDAGKHYLLREMSARQGEWWAARMLSAMARSGVDVPDNVLESGMAGIYALGVKMVLSALGLPDAKPLLDEMFDACVSIIPDPSKPTITRGAGGIAALTDDDIEDIGTLMMLRKEILGLHIDFFPSAVRSILTPMLGLDGSSPTT